ncbi:MAG TPA: LysR family transcriptional regulator [Ideonella sp.]|nr:LysR family transcriptional regulator [Ideonella sp.]
MDLSDLRMFLSATQHHNLNAAASELHLTASAVSRGIRRLETSLRTPLFDRVGKSLVLNAAGQRLRARAISLLDMAAATRAEFEGSAFKVHCRVAAPALLQWRWGAALAQALEAAQTGSSMVFRLTFEDDAVVAVARGEADLALVTQEAIVSGPQRHHAEGLAVQPLGTMAMQLAAGKAHPLAAGRAQRTVSTAQVLAQDFAAPSRSLFCGVGRGARSDGWRDDLLPRRIRYWIDDPQLLVQFVAEGRALAYLPDFAIDAAGLVRLRVRDCPYRCEESASLLWRPTEAAGWQLRMIEQLGKALPG